MIRIDCREEEYLKAGFRNHLDLLKESKPRLFTCHYWHFDEANTYLLYGFVDEVIKEMGYWEIQNESFYNLLAEIIMTEYMEAGLETDLTFELFDEMYGMN